MEIKKLREFMLPFFLKYKYAILILGIGIVLMLIPGTGKNVKAETKDIPDVIQSVSVQDELESILKLIHGAGNVKVLLKESCGVETIYQVDEEVSINDSSTNRKVDTIIISDQDRKEGGLIKQINPPKYLGAIVLCQGADDPSIKLAITNAVSKITGLGSDKIAVLKMK